MSHALPPTLEQVQALGQHKHYVPKRYRIVDGKKVMLPRGDKTVCGLDLRIGGEVVDSLSDVTCPVCLDGYKRPEAIDPAKRLTRSQVDALFN